ncbi:hypothetical protein Tco_0110756 [Tanacetum coccineum]
MWEKADVVVDAWSDVRTLIMEEAHAMRYYVRPGESKMIGLELEQETTKNFSKCLNRSAQAKLFEVRSRLVSDSTTRDVEWEPIEEERLEEPNEGWMLGESKKSSIRISSQMLIVGLVPRSRVTLVKASHMRELVVKYKAEKVCHEEMVKMPLVYLKVLEDGSFRMCIDYRELSKIDLYSDCHQMRVHEDEIPKTAFRMRYGCYEFMAMPFWVDQCTSDFHGHNESGDVRTLIIEEAHATNYSVRPGTDGQSERTFRTLENMFRACVRNLVVVGILTFREAEIGESKMIGLELEQETTKVVMIKERPKEAKDHQESIVRFDKKGELAPRTRFPKGWDTVKTVVLAGLFARLIEEFGFALHRVRSRLVSDSTTRDVEWEPIEEERLEEPKEGWMLGESKKRSIWISSRMLIVGLVPPSRVNLLKARKRISDKRTKNKDKNDKTEHGMEKREKSRVDVSLHLLSYDYVIEGYKAEKVCHKEMVKMPLVDLKVLEDRSFRMCIDYRELSKIDLYSDCYQMRVHEDEILKTAFRIRYGRYEFTAMPFWVDQCTSDFQGCNESGARVAFEDEFGAAEEREVSCEAQQGRSGVKRKLFGSCRNNMGNEPILALPEGSDNFVVMRGARVRMLA